MPCWSISPNVDDPNAAKPPAVVVPANCEILSVGSLKCHSIGHVVSLDAETELLSFANPERLAQRQIVIPVVESTQHAAVSDLAGVAGHEVRADVGVGKHAWNVELVELQFARRERP